VKNYTIRFLLISGITLALLGIASCSGKQAASASNTSQGSSSAAGQSATAGSGGSSTSGGAAGASLPALDSGYKKVQKDGFTVQWKVDGKNLDVAVSYATTGWVGVGFGTTGLMEGSNIIIGYVNNGNVTIEDDYGNAPNRHASDTSLGGTDNISNKQGAVTNGTTELRFSIPLDSGDSNDVVLTPGKPYKVILAHGPTGANDLTAYHGARGHAVVDITL